VILFEPLRKNWKNWDYLGGIPECKNWGNLYPIFSITIPVVFSIDRKI
jgi:hypothetical protein